MDLTKVLTDFVSLFFETLSIYYFLKYFVGECVLNKKRVYLFMTGFFVLSMLIVTFFHEFTVRAITQIIMLIILTGLFTNSVWKRLGYSTIIYIFSLLNEGLCMIAFMSIFNANSVEIVNNNIYYSFMAISSKINLLLFIFIIQFFIKKIKYGKGGGIYTGLVLTPVSSVFAIYYIVEHTSVNHYIFAISVAFLLVLSNLLVFYIFDNQSKIERNQIRLEFIEEQYKNQITHYNELYSARAEIHKMWHDMNNSLITLSSYANAGDIDGIVKYLNQQNKQMQYIRNIVDTNNPHIDSVINAKQRRMEGCEISYSIPDLSDVNIEPMDIAMLLATALDNAIEACDKLPKDLKKKIKIRIAIQGVYLSISVENTALDDLKIEDKKLKTTKKDDLRHGFGMDTIKRIVDKYEGDVSFRYSNGEFLLAILLKSHA